jgi:hypothetical protein
MIEVLINSAMQAERSKYLQTGEYERTEERKASPVVDFIGILQGEKMNLLYE